MMIESGITSRMLGIQENPGQTQHGSALDYRLLTTDPSQLKDDLPGDLQSLSWLTSVDVPRLQQMRAGQSDFSSSAQTSPMERQTGPMNNMTGAVSSLHLQSEMQHSPLAISSMPQFSPGFPCAASMFQTTPQQVLTFTQTNQQCSQSGLYGNYTSPNLFPQPRLTAHNQELQPKTFPKPIYSYSCLIAMALKNSKSGSLPVSEIYSFMKEHFPYFKTAPDGWKNSVRHNLSLNKCFEKVENKMSGSSRKGCLWALNPAKIDKMEEEMQKWKRKDLPAIRRSMANPDELDKLITDRPESCRQKAADVVDISRLSSCPAPQMQPVVTLSLQCLPMHQHLQMQIQSQSQSRPAPVSPAAAQTPPLHSALHHPTKQHGPDFYGMHSEGHSEVDALDPSIMDFSWQGNLWEDMKDDSFNLEALGTLSNSPLRLSDCDLDTGSATSVPGAYPDLYSSYAAVEALTHPYINTQGGTKPIILL